MMDIENVRGDCLDVVMFKTRKSEVKYEHVSCQVDQHVQVSRVGGGGQVRSEAVECSPPKQDRECLTRIQVLE